MIKIKQKVWAVHPNTKYGICKVKISGIYNFSNYKLYDVEHKIPRNSFLIYKKYPNKRVKLKCLNKRNIPCINYLDDTEIYLSYYTAEKAVRIDNLIDRNILIKYIDRSLI